MLLVDTDLEQRGIAMRYPTTWTTLPVVRDLSDAESPGIPDCQVKFSAITKFTKISSAVSWFFALTVTDLNKIR